MTALGRRADGDHEGVTMREGLPDGGRRGGNLSDQKPCVARQTLHNEEITSVSATLQETLLAPHTQPKVVADCLTLIQDELAEKSGVSGSAVKLAYKAIVKVKPDHIHHMVEVLVPQMAEQLQPYWADFKAGGGAADGTPFGDYLVKRGDEVSQALLAVTDRRAEESGRPVVVRTYSSVRGGAAKNVEAALPRVGALVQKYAV
jgi:hypothetical protein